MNPANWIDGTGPAAGARRPSPPACKPTWIALESGDPPALPYLALELTRRCNLECRHCYAESGPAPGGAGDLPLDAWLRCLRDGADEGLRTVQLIGGEPMLYPGAGRLVGAARELGYATVEIYSNLTRAPARMLERLAEHAVVLTTSLYGDTADSHDAMTGRAGSFRRTTTAIRRALDRRLRVRVAAIHAAGDDAGAARTMAVARSLGVDEVSHDAVRPYGRGRSMTACERACSRCGKGVVRVCQDGLIVGCAMRRAPVLGHLQEGLADAVRGLGRATGNGARPASLVALN